MGCSCGYIEDVLYPLKEKGEKVIALTEGRFKAEILSVLGYTTVNMHSISNWEPAGDVALALAEKIGAARYPANVSEMACNYDIVNPLAVSRIPNGEVCGQDGTQLFV